MMSDFFLTLPLPLDPIFTFYNPIFRVILDPPPTPKSDIIYVRSLMVKEYFPNLLVGT